MKTVLFRQYGGPEVLEYTDFPAPEPKAGEVLVRLHAASPNRMEGMDLIVSGELKPIMDKTFPLKDAAAAQERLWNADHFGKITLDIP
jgi:NADPH:quinone reductase-like Zn-dependent oxidoreductase